MFLPRRPFFQSPPRKFLQAWKPRVLSSFRHHRGSLMGKLCSLFPEFYIEGFSAADPSFHSAAPWPYSNYLRSLWHLRPRLSAPQAASYSIPLQFHSATAEGLKPFASGIPTLQGMLDRRYFNGDPDQRSKIPKFGDLFSGPACK